LDPRLLVNPSGSYNVEIVVWPNYPTFYTAKQHFGEFNDRGNVCIKWLRMLCYYRNVVLSYQQG